MHLAALSAAAIRYFFKMGSAEPPDKPFDIPIRN